MSEHLKALRENTDRRFGILMTGFQDFMTALQSERNEMENLIAIEKKATPPVPKPKAKTKKQPKKKD